MWSMTTTLLVVCLHLMLFSQTTAAAQCDGNQTIFCPAGCDPITDSEGCNTCNCSCQGVTCPQEQVCKLEQVYCESAPCPPLPMCVRRECDGQQPTSCPAGCELTTDGAGCKKCNCACQNVTCPPDKDCKLVQVFCIRAPCPPLPTCVPRDCDQQQPTSCPAGCQLTTDPAGCKRCNCACQNKTCPSGQVCRLVQVQCIRAPCPPLPMCVRDVCDKEKPTSCPAGCELITDREGCRMCNCACRNMTCRSDEACKLVPVQCIRGPCPPLPTCVRECDKEQPTSCPEGCELITNHEGCKMCNCACKNVTCPEKQVCKLVPVQCVRAPCPAQPQCVDEPGNQAELQTSTSIQMIIVCLGAALAAWTSGPAGLARRE